MSPTQKPRLRLHSILRARCPACHRGKITSGFSILPRCPECGQDLNPENGFYLGAMVVAYLLTAILTIPPMIVLKIMEVDTSILIAFPLIEFIFVGTFLLFYARIIWLHLEYRMTHQLDGER